MLVLVDKLNALWATKNGCTHKHTVFHGEMFGSDGLDVTCGFIQHPSCLTSLGVIHVWQHRVQEGSLDAQYFFSVNSNPGYPSTTSSLRNHINYLLVLQYLCDVDHS